MRGRTEDKRIAYTALWLKGLKIDSIRKHLILTILFLIVGFIIFIGYYYMIPLIILSAIIGYSLSVYLEYEKKFPSKPSN